MENHPVFVKITKHPLESLLAFGGALVLSSAVSFGLGVAEGESRVGANASVPVPGTPTLTSPSIPLSSPESRKVDLIQADSGSYYTKPAVVKALVSPDSYYNYAFSESAGTHYSFAVEGDSSRIYAYGERTKFKDLFDYLSQQGGKGLVEVTIQTSPSHGDNQIWSLVSWKKV